MMRRFFYHILIAALIVTIACFGHRRVLSGAAGFLSVGDADVSRATHVVPLSGWGAVEAAGRWASAADGRSVLLWEETLPRSVQCGAVQRLSLRQMASLVDQGVDREKIGVADAGLESSLGIRLGQWLAEHPDQVVLILVNEFESRQTMLMVNSSMDAATRARILFQPIPDPRYGRDTWWHSRRGWKAVMYSSISLLFASAVSADDHVKPGARPDAYEKLFLDHLARAGTQ